MDVTEPPFQEIPAVWSTSAPGIGDSGYGSGDPILLADGVLCRIHSCRTNRTSTSRGGAASPQPRELVIMGRACRSGQQSSVARPACTLGPLSSDTGHKHILLSSVTASDPVRPAGSPVAPESNSRERYDG